MHCVKSPTSSKIRSLIRTIAIYVHNRGMAFETQLLRRVEHDGDSEKWRFLLNEECEEHTYYKWCVLVLGNNETFSKYSFLPFQFMDDGDYYLPPPQYNEEKVNQEFDEKIANLNKLKTTSVKRSAEDDRRDEERIERRKAVQG